MSDTYTAIIGNTLEELSSLCQGAHEFMEKSGLPDGAIFKLDLALEELLTNIIKYGYDDLARHEIAISIGIDTAQTILTISDDSHQFDPTTAKEPDLENDLSARKIGGVGLHLIRNMVEQFTYSRQDGINLITITVPR